MRGVGEFPSFPSPTPLCLFFLVQPHFPCGQNIENPFWLPNPTKIPFGSSTLRKRLLRRLLNIQIFLLAHDSTVKFFPHVTRGLTWTVTVFSNLLCKVLFVQWTFDLIDWHLKLIETSDILGDRQSVHFIRKKAFLRHRHQVLGLVVL